MLTCANTKEERGTVESWMSPRNTTATAKGNMTHTAVFGPPLLYAPSLTLLVPVTHIVLLLLIRGIPIVPLFIVLLIVASIDLILSISSCMMSCNGRIFQNSLENNILLLELGGWVTSYVLVVVAQLITDI